MKPLKDNPLVSIVTLNWNGLQITSEFLESTRNLTYKNYEIIVIDNASNEDPTARIMAANYPHVRVVRSDVNLGFAGGNNFGIKHFSPDYDFCFLINNDAEVTPDIIEQCLQPFYEDESIGVVCPKIRFHHHPDIIQYAGFNKMNMLTGQTTAVGSLEKDNGQHNISGFTHSAHGCAMLVSRQVIEKVGMLAEKFFIYYEESDWSARILKAGYKIYYQATGLIFHKESMTMGKLSPIKVYYMTRNRIYYMRRNAGLGEFVAFAGFFSLLTVPKTIFKFIRNKQYGHLKSFAKGIAWNFSNSTKSVQ